MAGLQTFLSKAAAATTDGRQPDIPRAFTPLSQPAASAAADVGVLHWRRCQWPGQAAAADHQAALAAAASGSTSGWPGIASSTSADGASLQCSCVTLKSLPCSQLCLSCDLHN